MPGTKKLSHRLFIWAVPSIVFFLAVSVLIIVIPLEQTSRIGLIIFAGLIALIMVSCRLSRKLSRQLIRLTHQIQKPPGNGDSTEPLSIFEFERLLESTVLIQKNQIDRIKMLSHQKRELDVMLSNMMEALLVIDVEERLIRMNPAAGNLFEVNPDACLGRPIETVFRHPDLQRFIRKALSYNTPQEEIIQLSTNETKYLHVHGNALLSDENQIIGALIVLNDITKIKQLENMRRDFVANVSHELKTPITTIKGFAETLIEGGIEDPAQIQQYLQIILRNSDRLNAIIEDLLNLSRIEQDAESQQITLETGSLNQTIRNALAACSVKSNAKDIRLTFDPDRDIFIRMNSPLIENALVNLIDNAVKYSDRGHPVSIATLEKQGSVIISVQDHGCGISADHIPRIFERFYRVDKARSRQMGGTGLGLAIVKHIINAHQGKISVESRIGQGSTFSIELPR